MLQMDCCGMLKAVVLSGPAEQHQQACWKCRLNNCCGALQDAAEGREHVTKEGNQNWLELLLGISGAFRPGVLTCLMVGPAAHAPLKLHARSAPCSPLPW